VIELNKIVGKSTLLNKLTSTESETASYEVFSFLFTFQFTTLTCIPGVIDYQVKWKENFKTREQSFFFIFLKLKNPIIGSSWNY
jgi:uncharacterized membrane protein YesL